MRVKLDSHDIFEPCGSRYFRLGAPSARPVCLWVFEPGETANLTQVWLTAYDATPFQGGESNRVVWRSAPRAEQLLSGRTLSRSIAVQSRYGPLYPGPRCTHDETATAPAPMNLLSRLPATDDSKSPKVPDNRHPLKGILR